MIPELLQLVGAVAALGLLWWGAESLVTAAARISRHYGVSDYLIGMTVVAIGTSAPEMVVTLVAAFQGYPDVSVGNVVGSNIFNLFLILGLCGAIWTVPTARAQVYNDVPLLVGAAALLLFFLRDLALDAGEGVIFLVLFAAYGWWVLRRDDAGADPGEEVPAGEATWHELPRLAVGVAAVLGGSYLLVNCSVALARAVGASEWTIGVTLVAAGTSVPELATSLAAGRRGHLGLLAGNLIGSDIVNVLGVLGLAAALNPLHVDPAARVGVWTMLLAMGLLCVLMRTGWRLTRAEGWVLLAIAVVRWGLDLSQRSGGS
jgi:cation:H+ antiporter